MEYYCGLFFGIDITTFCKLLELHWSFVSRIALPRMLKYKSHQLETFFMSLKGMAEALVFEINKKWIFRTLAPYLQNLGFLTTGIDHQQRLQDVLEETKGKELRGLFHTYLVKRFT